MSNTIQVELDITSCDKLKFRQMNTKSGAMATKTIHAPRR